MNVLFVCLGNICRSPAGEGIFQKMVNDNGLQHHIKVDSAGLDEYHKGEMADKRMLAAAAKRGYTLTSRSRKVTPQDFYDYDLILSMDDSVHQTLLEWSPDIETSQKVVRMTDYCSKIQADHVPDPYLGGLEGFEHVLDILEESCRNLLNTLSRNK